MINFGFENIFTDTKSKTTQDVRNEQNSPYTTPDLGEGSFDRWGFLNKAGETAVDVFGLWGMAEIAKDFQPGVGANRENPEITAMRQQDRIGNVNQMAQMTGWLVMGGAIVLGFMAFAKVKGGK